jgi:hypothetical protein
MNFYNYRDALAHANAQPWPQYHHVVRDRHWSVRDDCWKPCFTVQFRPGTKKRG